jgi:hypothetical protein
MRWSTVSPVGHRARYRSCRIYANEPRRPEHRPEAVGHRRSRLFERRLDPVPDTLQQVFARELVRFVRKQGYGVDEPAGLIRPAG